MINLIFECKKRSKNYVDEYPYYRFKITDILRKKEQILVKLI